MMTFQQKTKEVPGLLYVAESMEFMSSAGRRRMMEQPLLTEASAIDASQEDVQAFRTVLGNEEYALATNKLRHQLMQLHDLQTSLSSLRSHVVLEEVELFEIKVFAHLCGHARQALEAMALAARFPLPDLQEVFRLLDPDGTGIPGVTVIISSPSAIDCGFDFAIVPVIKLASMSPVLLLFTASNFGAVFFFCSSIFTLYIYIIIFV